MAAARRPRQAGNASSLLDLRLIDNVRLGNHAVVSTLIGSGADVNVEGQAGDDFPLRLAAERGDLRMVKLLLDAGADVHVVSRDGIEDIVQSMRDSGVEPGFNAETRPSVLRAALNSRNAACIDLILAAGADPLHVSRCNSLEKDLSDVAYAEYYAAPDVAIRVAGAALRFELVAAAAENDMDKLRDILAAGGGPIDLADRFGVTPLIYASLHGNAQMAALLLNHGADPFLAERYNPASTPLSAAEKFGHRPVVDLLQAAADRHRAAAVRTALSIDTHSHSVPPMRLRRPSFGQG